MTQKFSVAMADSDSSYPQTPESSANSDKSVENCWTEERIQDVARLWSFSEQQLTLFRELQERIADIDHWKNCPEEVARFFMGPEGHKKAEKIFRNMIAWRKEHDVDTILQDYSPPQLLLKYIPIGVMQGLDKEGDPIYVDRGGAVSPSCLMKRFGWDELYKYGIWFRESLSTGDWHKDYEREVGRPVRCYTVVYDLHGLSSKQMNATALEMFKLNIQMTDNYYTGPMKRMVVIRAPSIFRMFWGMVKHMIPKESQKKIMFASQSNYLEVLGKYMDRSVLPDCICAEGEGEVIKDLSGIEFHGGELPAPCSSDFLRVKLLNSDGNDSMEAESVATELSSDESVCDMGNEKSNVKVTTMSSGYWRKQRTGGTSSTQVHFS